MIPDHVCRIAVFDIDGTLIGDNIGITFVKYLNRLGVIRTVPKVVVILGFALFKCGLVGFAAAIRLGYIALAGLAKEDVSKWAADCFSSSIRPQLFAAAAAEIARLKQEGALVLLATGAHEAIAGPVSEFLGADYLVCTRSRVADGVYGWGSIGELPYREGKRDLVAQAIQLLTTEQPPHVSVYSDDEKDAVLFDLADECIGVNADDTIRQLVIRRGGRLISFA